MKFHCWSKVTTYITQFMCLLTFTKIKTKPECTCHQNLNPWKVWHYQFNRMNFFSPRIHTKEHVLALQKGTFKYLGTAYTMWKMKKHQKKKASERSSKGNSGFHKRMTISKNLICLVCKSEHSNVSVSVQELYFPLSGYIFVIITILRWIMVRQRWKIWGTAISRVAYYSQKQYICGVLEKIYT